MSIASTSGEGHSTALPVSEWNVTTMPDLQHQEFIMMPSSTAPSVSTDTAVKATGSQEEVSNLLYKQPHNNCTAQQVKAARLFRIHWVLFVSSLHCKIKLRATHLQ